MYQGLIQEVIGTLGLFDKTIKIWDTATGQCQATLEGHGEKVESVAFSPDGQRVASGSWDSMIKLWDATMGQCQATLEGHRNSVRSVAFSPNGQRVASGSDDGTAKIWDTATGQCQATLKGHVCRVESVAFSPDGQHLASVSWSSIVKIWDVTTGQWLVEFNVGGIPRTIRFDETGAGLLTDAGRLNVPLPSHRLTPMRRAGRQARIDTLSALIHSHDPPEFQSYGISADNAWITYRGRNMLRLPSDYRLEASAFAASTVALGCFSGRVLLFRFTRSRSVE